MNLFNNLLNAIIVVGLAILNPFAASVHADELTGTVSLPNGATATANMDIVMTMSIYDASGNYLTQANTVVTINADSNSALYALSHDPAPASGSYSVAVDCNSSCGTYINSLIFLQDDGTSGLTVNNISEGSLPSPADFELIESLQLTGSISLPNATDNSEDIEAKVFITTFDSSGNPLASNFTTATIITGTLSSFYSLNYAPAPSNGSYEVYTVCESNCDNYLSSKIYLQDNGTTAPGANNVDGALPLAADFELLKRYRLSGTVSLPNGATASEDIRGSLRLSNFDASDRQITFRFLTVTISAGTNSSSYSLDHDPAPDGGSYKVHFSCASNCGNYLPDIYLQDDGTISQIENIVDADTFSSTVDFELINSAQLIGSIRLPDNATATANMEVELSITTYDTNGDYVTDISSTVFINNGSSSSPYSLMYQLAPAGGSYQVSLACEINCGTYLTSPLFLQDDGSSNIIDNNIEGALPSSADFELIQDANYTGTISLPNNATAAADISVLVQLTTYDANGQFLIVKSTVATILTGSTSATYFISHEPVPAEVSYEVIMFCFENCDNYLRSRQYLQDDGSTALGRNIVDAAPPLTLSVDFELIETAPLTGVVSLPNGDNAVADILIRLSVSILDENDNFVTGVNTDVTINSGSSSAHYSLAYAPLQDGEHYQVILQCDVNCGNYVRSLLYLQDDYTSGFSNNLIDTALPETVDFELIEATLLSGTVSLPNNATAAAFIHVTTTIATYDANGESIADFSVGSAISTGESSTPYSVAYVPAPEGGSYEVHTYCVLGCGTYLSSRIYLQDNGTTELGNNTIEAAVALAETVNFELIDGTSMEVTPVADLSVANPSYSANTSANEVTWLRINHAGGTLSCNTFGSDFNTDIALYSSEGTVVFLNDDANNGLQSEIDIGVGSGTYFLAVAGHDAIFKRFYDVDAGADSGNLVVTCLLADAYENDNDQTTNNDVSGMVTQSHSIHQAGESDWITFSINAPSDVSISAQSLYVSDGAPIITVYDSSLNEVQVSDERSATLSEIKLSQLAAGTYYIEVKGFSSTSTNARYTLRFEGQKIDDLCFPIIAKSSKLAVICL